VHFVCPLAHENVSCVRVARDRIVADCSGHRFLKNSGWILPNKLCLPSLYVCSIGRWICVENLSVFCWQYCVNKVLSITVCNSGVVRIFVLQRHGQLSTYVLPNNTHTHAHTHAHAHALLLPTRTTSGTDVNVLIRNHWFNCYVVTGRECIIQFLVMKTEDLVDMRPLKFVISCRYFGGGLCLHRDVSTTRVDCTGDGDSKLFCNVSSCLYVGTV
jgi:hypothetical protein